MDKDPKLSLKESRKKLKMLDDVQDFIYHIGLGIKVTWNVYEQSNNDNDKQ